MVRWLRSIFSQKDPKDGRHPLFGDNPKCWWKLSFGYRHSRLHLSLMEHAPALPDMERPRYGRDLNLILILDPREWHWALREHIWYDGPHDAWTVGPFCLSWSPVDCEECYEGWRIR